MAATHHALHSRFEKALNSPTDQSLTSVKEHAPSEKRGFAVS